MSKRKRLILLIAMLVLLAAGAVVFWLWRSAPPRVKAEDFTLRTRSGTSISLSDYEGKSPVVVTFWASWCSDCREELPAVWRVASDYEDDRLPFLMVNSTSGVQETEEAALRYLDENGLDFRHVLLDEYGEAASAYELYFIPCTLLIDREGYIVKRVDDVMGEAELRAEVEHLLQSAK